MDTRYFHNGGNRSQNRLQRNDARSEKNALYARCGSKRRADSRRTSRKDDAPFPPSNNRENVSITPLFQPDTSGHALWAWIDRDARAKRSPRAPKRPTPVAATDRRCASACRSLAKHLLLASGRWPAKPSPWPSPGNSRSLFATMPTTARSSLDRPCPTGTTG